MLESFIEKTPDPQERNRAREKLNQIVSFASRHKCRRRALLAYFGETFPKHNCGNCDFCCANTEQKDATEISYKILSAIVRLKQNCGFDLLIDVLRGSTSKRATDYGRNQLPVYGIAKDNSHHEIRAAISALMNEEYLILSNDQFPVLQLTENGADAIKKREKILLRLPKIQKPPERMREKALDYSEILLEELKNKRKILADQRNIPPYMVFSDKSLQEMAYFIPLSSDDLIRISGVGVHKARMYGKEFMDVIRRVFNEQNLSSRMNEMSEVVVQKPKPFASTRTRRIEDFLERGISIGKIVEMEGVTDRTVYTHIEKLVDLGKIVDINPFVSPEMFEEIRVALKQKPNSMLKELKEALEDQSGNTKEYPYHSLSIARAKIFAKKGSGTDTA